MKTRLVLLICLTLIFLTACGRAPIPAPTVGPTATPTPIGVTEPRVAFVGKDAQGELGVYVDGFYTGIPEKISPVTVPEEEAPHLLMRWSPDGTKLMFLNNNQLNTGSFFLFDAAANRIQEIAKVPGGKDVFNFRWSPDGNIFYFGAASPDNPGTVFYKLDLSNVQITETDEVFFVNDNSHVHSLVNCDETTFPEAIRALLQNGSPPPYDRICFHPELNAYAGLKYNEQTTDFVFFTQEGEVDRTLMTFPANFVLNGFMDLLLSPDKSQILIIGQGGVESFGNGCCDIAYPTSLTSPPLNLSSLKIYEGRPHFIHVYGWSPDGMNYLIAERNLNTDNPLDRFEIIRASSGEIVYTYGIHKTAAAVFSVGQSASGYDMVWPAPP